MRSVDVMLERHLYLQPLDPQLKLTQTSLAEFKRIIVGECLTFLEIFQACKTPPF